MNKNSTEEQMSSEKEKTSDKALSSDLWTSEEKDSVKSLYGCEILKQNCTLQEAKTKEAPKDAYIVSYLVNGNLCYDLTRSGGKMVKIFDMYYDKFGNNIKSIVWGNGTISPKLWGYEPPKPKKRK
jgi:hypothetical protein